jgi:pantoate--beta-alanine ligase
MMQVVSEPEALRQARAALSGRVGAVFTMGALHAGHISLVEAARAANDAVVATIFVNPLQFRAGEDFAAYPRDLARDLAMLEQVGVDLVFTPDAATMYPPGFQTSVHTRRVSRGLEGAQRPGHFRGVATVVAKLFNLTRPDAAYFGQKDAQQVVVIRRMVRDLDFPLDIVVCPTLREGSGLAMSSRNAYLSPQARAQAAVLYRALAAAQQAYADGERAAAALVQAAHGVLASESAGHIEYISVNDPATLRPIKWVHRPVLLSLAVRVEGVRLLDNTLLPPVLNTQAGLTAVLGAAQGAALPAATP